MSRPLISALIVNWNTCQDTLACLDALQAARPKAHDFETIVVENGSRDGSLAALRSRRDIELLANPENRGFAAAVNQAYRIARGELVLLLNPDVTVHQDTLEALIRFLDCHPKVAGVGPAYLNPDGTPQQHHYRLPTFSALIAAVSSLRRLPPWRRAARRHRMLEESFAEPRQLEQPSASCLLLRRDRLPPGPLLDEDFPIYFNDVMLARRLAQRGAALWMTPSAIVHHQLGGSTRQLGDSLSHHHLASIVRYASRTLPAHQVACLKLVIVVEAIGKRVLHRPAPLHGRALRSALRGDPAPLPGTAVD